MAFDLNNFLSGASGGAEAGAEAGGPWGAVAGGLFGGAASSLFGGKNSPNFSGLNDIIAQRQRQIDDFAAKLEAARGNVLSNYQNLATSTVKNFMPQFEASLAGRGISANGGAFASGVGREAANLQSGYNMLNANMTSIDMSTIAGMEEGLFAPSMNLGTMETMIPWQMQQENKQAIGTLTGVGANLLGRYLNTWNPSARRSTYATGQGYGMGGPLDLQNPYSNRSLLTRYLNPAVQ